MYPSGPSVKTDAQGTIHLVWTLNDARGSAPDCILSLHYSRLSPEGVVRVEDQALGYEVGADSCGQLTPSWTVVEDGSPVILDLHRTNETLTPFDLPCSFNCEPSGAQAGDGTWWVVTALSREERRGQTRFFYTHIALYRQAPSRSLEKVAILASNDPSQPVTLPAETTALLLTVLGALLVPVGAVGFLLALSREEPKRFRRLEAWIRAKRFHLVVAVGIGLMAASALLPWFMGLSPPDLGAPFRNLLGLELGEIPALTPLLAPAAVLLLAARSRRLLRSLCLGLLALNAPVWWLFSFFKNAPGLDAGSGVALTGLLLTYLAAGRIQDEGPLLYAPWPFSVAASVTVTGAGLFLLLPLRSIFLLALGVGLLVGGLSYLAAAVNEVLRER